MPWPASPSPRCPSPASWGWAQRQWLHRVGALEGVSCLITASEFASVACAQHLPSGTTGSPEGPRCAASSSEPGFPFWTHDVARTWTQSEGGGVLTPAQDRAHVGCPGGFAGSQPSTQQAPTRVPSRQPPPRPAEMRQELRRGHSKDCHTGVRLANLSLSPEEPLPSFSASCSPAFKTVGCEPPVGFEISLVGLDQIFCKK